MSQRAQLHPGYEGPSFALSSVLKAVGDADYSPLLQRSGANAEYVVLFKQSFARTVQEFGMGLPALANVQRASVYDHPYTMRPDGLRTTRARPVDDEYQQNVMIMLHQVISKLNAHTADSVYLFKERLQTAWSQSSETQRKKAVEKLCSVMHLGLGTQRDIAAVYSGDARIPTTTRSGVHDILAKLATVPTMDPDMLFQAAANQMNSSPYAEAVVSETDRIFLGILEDFAASTMVPAAIEAAHSAPSALNVLSDPPSQSANRAAAATVHSAHSAPSAQSVLHDDGVLGPLPAQGHPAPRSPRKPPSAASKQKELILKQNQKKLKTVLGSMRSAAREICNNNPSPQNAENTKMLEKCMTSLHRLCEKEKRILATIPKSTMFNNNGPTARSIIYRRGQHALREKLHQLSCQTGCLGAIFMCNADLITTSRNVDLYISNAMGGSDFAKQRTGEMWNQFDEVCTHVEQRRIPNTAAQQEIYRQYQDLQRLHEQSEREHERQHQQQSEQIRNLQIQLQNAGLSSNAAVADSNDNDVEMGSQ